MNKIEPEEEFLPLVMTAMSQNCTRDRNVFNLEKLKEI